MYLVDRTTRLIASGDHWDSRFGGGRSAPRARAAAADRQRIPCQPGTDFYSNIPVVGR